MAVLPTCIYLSLCFSIVSRRLYIRPWLATLNIPSLAHLCHCIRSTRVRRPSHNMPTFPTRFPLSRARSRRRSPRPTRKLTFVAVYPTLLVRKLMNAANRRSHNKVATLAAVELDPELQSIHVVRKPRNTVKRRLIMFWKHLSTPSRPRASRRFSFMPPDFDLVSHDVHFKSKRDSRRISKYWRHRLL
ncbi:hypothetical protein B0H12DRAFT_1117598, partial [Mycena haematopus]